VFEFKGKPRREFLIVCIKILASMDLEFRSYAPKYTHVEEAMKGSIVEKWS